MLLEITPGAKSGPTRIWSARRYVAFCWASLRWLNQDFVFSNTQISNSKLSFFAINIKCVCLLHRQFNLSVPTFLLTMSAFILFGNFCLAGGERKPTEKTSTTGAPIYVNHFYYDTTITLLDGELQAELRIYSPPGDVRLPDNTVVFAVTHAHITAQPLALLEAQTVFPYPGDPSSGTYQDGLPALPATFFIGVGPSRTTANVKELAPDGQSRAFTLDLSNYVRDALNSSLVQYVICNYFLITN
jgi:hypothetical protein